MSDFVQMGALLTFHIYLSVDKKTNSGYSNTIKPLLKYYRYTQL